MRKALVSVRPFHQQKKINSLNPGGEFSISEKREIIFTRWNWRLIENAKVL